MSDSYTERDIHAQIARLARDLHSYEHSGKTIDTLLLAVTRQAVDMLDEVDHAGVTLVDRRGRVRSTAATGPVPTRIDELQGTHQQGPCLQTIREHTTVRVKDFGSETRWPSFVEDLIVQTPVRSALSVLLYTEDSELGALNLYADEAGVFDDSTVTALIIENAPNLRTLIFGEIPNLFQREPRRLSNPNLPVVIQYNGED